MRFKDVPIFYSPYLAFPLGDDRQSGLLFPSFGHSGNNGYQLEVPYYFNLAPNYDATLTPGYLSKRGVQLELCLAHLRARIARRGAALLLATHSLDIVEHYADRAAVLIDGNLKHVL